MNEVQSIDGTAMQARELKAHEKVERQLVTRKSEFQKVLPAHISFEKFQRTVMTACFSNPDLFQCDLGSLLLSAIKCATDGLLPDNREAAFVIFNSKVAGPEGKDVWIKKAQYLPMWAGILKKIRIAGEVDSVRTHIVYEADWKKGKFEYVLGDEERIIHEPYLGPDPKGPIIAAYCIAKLKSGEIIREVMTFDEIEKVRRTSKSGSIQDSDLKYNKGAVLGDAKGIWKDWYPEMARKTVFRRAAKWLPQSADLIDRIFENDESIDTIEHIAPAEIMDSNPKAVQTSVDSQDQALIENNPTMPMETPSGSTLDKVVARQTEEKVLDQPDQKQPPVDAKTAKLIKMVESAIRIEETASGLDEIFDKDYTNEIEAIKKANVKAFQKIVDMAEQRRQEIASEQSPQG